MPKKTKILILVGSLAVILIFYLLVSLKEVKIKISGDNGQNQAQRNNMIDELGEKQIEENYRAGIKPFISEYERFMQKIAEKGGKEGGEKALSGQEAVTASSGSEIIQEENDIFQEISRLKLNAMEFTVPEKFRDMHLKLVLSLSLIEEYYESSSIAKKDLALKQFSEVLDNYADL